jgi:hypothetical protein
MKVGFPASQSRHLAPCLETSTAGLGAANHWQGGSLDRDSAPGEDFGWALATSVTR